MPSFLVCYDYGQGRDWLYLNAETPQQIRDEYPRLTVFESAPSFWNARLEALARTADPITNSFWRDWLERQQKTH